MTDEFMDCFEVLLELCFFLNMTLMFLFLLKFFSSVFFKQVSYMLFHMAVTKLI